MISLGSWLTALSSSLTRSYPWASSACASLNPVECLMHCLSCNHKAYGGLLGRFKRPLGIYCFTTLTSSCHLVFFTALIHNWIKCIVCMHFGRPISCFSDFLHNVKNLFMWSSSSSILLPMESSSFAQYPRLEQIRLSCVTSLSRWTLLTTYRQRRLWFLGTCMLGQSDSH